MDDKEVDGHKALVKKVTEIFSSCNEHVSKKISLSPNLHEEYLDQEFVQTLVDYMREFDSPIDLPSGWKLTIEARFLGGFFVFKDREIADLAFLVHYM